MPPLATPDKQAEQGNMRDRMACRYAEVEGVGDSRNYSSSNGTSISVGVPADPGCGVTGKQPTAYGCLPRASLTRQDAAPFPSRVQRIRSCPKRTCLRPLYLRPILHHSSLCNSSSSKAGYRVNIARHPSSCEGSGSAWDQAYRGTVACAGDHVHARCRSTNAS